jgi:hypothetical protein
MAFGAAMFGGDADASLDSHVRYLSGVLAGLGLAFWASLPRIEEHGARFRLLGAMVVAGGLARLFGIGFVGWPGWPMALALVMELVVAPLLVLWQGRVARNAAPG